MNTRDIMLIYTPAAIFWTVMLIGFVVQIHREKRRSKRT